MGTTEKLDPEKCYTNIGGFPGMSAPCKFPFTYKGNEYHKCIKKDWDNHWCELDMNHSASHKGHTFKISHESHKWGNCMAGKSCGFEETEYCKDVENPCTFPGCENMSCEEY